MRHAFNSSQTRSHSNELEHRVTRTEALVERLHEVHEDLRTDHEDTKEDHDRRINLQEKAILGIAGILYILAQDKFPQIAALVKSLHP